MAETDPFLAVLRKHFPDANIPDDEQFFTNGWVGERPAFGVIDLAETERALKTLRKNIDGAFWAFAALDPAVARALEQGFREESRRIVTEGPGRSPQRGGREAHLGKTLTHLHDIITVALAALDLDEFHGRSREAKASGTFEKIAFVEHARSRWRRYAGSEPGLHSDEFTKFLQDLADCHDKLNPEFARHWDARGLVDAYRRREKLAHGPQKTAGV